MQPPVPTSRATLLARGLALRCANCGGRGLFEHWLRMKTRCPTCGLKLDRGHSEARLGGNVVNLAIAEGTFAIIFVAIVLATRPSPPWDVLQWVLPAGMLIMPFIMYPLSKTIWLALDLIGQPATDRDF